MDATPFFTIVTSTLKSADTFGNLAASIRDQTFADWEFIVVDAAFDPATLAAVRSCDDTIDWWLSAPDTGIYQAWNRALTAMRGTWILFLGADDKLWDSHVLADAARLLQSLPQETRVAYGLVNVLSAEGAVLFTWGGPWEAVAERLRHGMSIPHTGTFHHKDLFAEHGPFDESFAIAGDFEFLLRELSHCPAAFLGNRTITAMATGGKGSNAATQRARIRESVEARRRHGMLPGPSVVPSVIYEFDHLVRERYPALHKRVRGPLRTASRIAERLKQRGH